jgi:hypothetical protein
LSKGKDKSLCMSVDYRPLSAVTDKTNICWLTSIFCLIGGHEPNSSPRSIFAQATINSRINCYDIPKTVFSTRYDLHEYLILSLGLVSTSAYFMHRMDLVFMPNWISWRFYASMIFWCTQRMRSTMQNT